MNAQYSFAQTRGANWKLSYSSSNSNPNSQVQEQTLVVLQKISNQLEQNNDQANVKNDILVVLTNTDQRIQSLVNLTKTAERAFFSLPAPYYASQILLHLIGEPVFLAFPPLSTLLWGGTFATFLVCANYDLIRDFETSAKKMLGSSPKTQQKTLPVRRVVGKRFGEIKKTWRKDLRF